MNKFYDKGIKFECQRCGNCCTCSGYVFLFDKDIKRILKETKFTLQDLERHYISSYGDYIVLRDKENGDCIFWNDEIKGCEIYKARPTQCRTYPFWNTIMNSEEKWNKEKKSCPGIDVIDGKLFTAEEIDDLRKQR